MSQDLLKAQKLEDKKLALDLRRQGRSYSEIQKKVCVPKATLSLWLKNIKLSRKQRKRLAQKRVEAAKRGSEKKRNQTLLQIEGIKSSAQKDIKKISKRELWLLGVMLYWKERLNLDNYEDLKKGVRFTSSDPAIIKLFLKWLKDVGGLKNEELGFDLFIPKSQKKSVKKIKEFWARIVSQKDLHKKTNVYFQKIRQKKTKRKTSKTPHGLLRIRVKASSMLARQIAGWKEGMKKIIVNN